MNEPEDRLTPIDRPAPYGGPPAPSADPEPDQTVAETGPAPAAEPSARWEDVVDPEPVTAPAPARDPNPVADEWPAPVPPRPAPASASASAPAPAARRTEPMLDDDAVDDDLDGDGYGDFDARTSRWVSLLATLGTALIGIVTVQVLASIVEGLTLKSGQRVGVPDDVLHRLGYPFGGLGATALVFLVLGVVLVAMPSVLDELLSESQDRVVGIALMVATAMGVIIAIGSLLAVRANLHEYSAKNVPVPSYVRVQFTNFLLGSLGAAALALFGSVAVMNERKRESL